MKYKLTCLITIEWISKKKPKHLPWTLVVLIKLSFITIIVSLLINVKKHVQCPQKNLNYILHIVKSIMRIKYTINEHRRFAAQGCWTRSPAARKFSSGAFPRCPAASPAICPSTSALRSSRSIVCVGCGELVCSLDYKRLVWLFSHT